MHARHAIGPVIWLLLMGLPACRSAAPIALDPIHPTTLHVGDRAVLTIPSDQSYLQTPNGAWRPVLELVNQSGPSLIFRAVREGKGVIILSPATAEDECISCATVQYIVSVGPPSYQARRVTDAVWKQP